MVAALSFYENLKGRGLDILNVFFRKVKENLIGPTISAISKFLLNPKIMIIRYALKFEVYICRNSLLSEAYHGSWSELWINSNIKNQPGTRVTKIKKLIFK